MSSINDAIERARIIGDLHSKITALEQERDRLREALERISAETYDEHMAEVADAALAKHAELTK